MKYSTNLNHSTNEVVAANLTATVSSSLFTGRYPSVNLVLGTTFKSDEDKLDRLSERFGAEPRSTMRY